MILATHGPADWVDNIYLLGSYAGVLTMAALVIFLYAAIRCWQWGSTPGRLNLVWGFALVLAYQFFQIAILSSALVLSYSPWLAQDARENMYPPGWGWWEPWLWWGQWVPALVGYSLVAVGFVKEGRRMVREALARDFRGHAS